MVERARAGSKSRRNRQTEQMSAQPERWRGSQLFQLVEPNLRKSEQIERKVATISGAAAHAFATRIFKNHLQQFQQQRSKELVSPLSESQIEIGTFNEVIVVDEKYPMSISLNVRRKDSWIDQKQITLPILLNDKTYVIKVYPFV